MNGPFFLSLVALLIGFSSAAFDQSEENRTLAFLNEYNKRAPAEEMKDGEASWKYVTNLTTYSREERTKAKLVYSLYMQSARNNASRFDKSKLSPDTLRQIQLIVATASPKSEDMLKKLTDLEGQMEEIYGSGKVRKDGKELSLDPDLYRILSSSRHYEDLKFVWKGWRDATGPRLRPLYEQFVEASNKGAKENGWKDTGAWWRSWYEVDNLETIVETLYNQLKPLYEELHAYVRYKLRKTYPQVSEKGPIPAHLFGNMWAQSWVNIYDLMQPYTNQPSLDVTQNMVKQNYTAKKMVQLAESFFVSIGLKKLPVSFYEKSMFTKPEDREVVCHASAWDFMINNDVRIKQCIDITHGDLVTAHHELGHIQYFLQYWNQAYEYRAGANPGFHEAVGDTLSLSVDTPQHLKRIGLLESVSNGTESDINALLKMALRKIAFLPFGFMIDQWRWKVFKGDITSKNYNKKWWELRTKYQGIKPPVCRTEKDFDPGAKYHIPANTPYIRYFVSYVLQFQFHKAACEAAGVSGALHQCSIYNSTVAGQKLGTMLAMGKSKPWPDALQGMIGSKALDVGPLKDYFKPLSNWLESQRATHKYPIGWDTEGAYQECDDSTTGTATNVPALFFILGASLSVLANVLY